MKRDSATNTIVASWAFCLLALSSCALSMAVDLETRKSFIVPDICNADMHILENAQTCARDLLPIGKSYGETALAKLELVKDMIPTDKLKRSIETRVTINEKCIENAQPTMDLYDAGDHYVAAEIGAEALSECFFFAGLVLENFGAGDEGAALTEAGSRALWGLYADDEFLIRPPELALGPR